MVGLEEGHQRNAGGPCLCPAMPTARGVSFGVGKRKISQSGVAEEGRGIEGDMGAPLSPEEFTCSLQTEWSRIAPLKSGSEG